MHTTICGMTGLGSVATLSAATQELSALVGVNSVTIKVEPNGLSLVTITGLSKLDDAQISAAVKPLGCTLVHLAVAS